MAHAKEVEEVDQVFRIQSEIVEQPRTAVDRPLAEAESLPRNMRNTKECPSPLCFLCLAPSSKKAHNGSHGSHDEAPMSELPFQPHTELALKQETDRRDILIVEPKARKQVVVVPPAPRLTREQE